MVAPTRIQKGKETLIAQEQIGRMDDAQIGLCEFVTTGTAEAEDDRIKIIGLGHKTKKLRIGIGELQNGTHNFFLGQRKEI